MKKILLVCAAGMSTSLLVNKMKDEASQQGINVEIKAVAKEKLAENIEGAHVVLLGPQIGYLEDDFKEAYSDLQIPIRVINSIDYGMMNGKKILAEAL
ncbi:PTS sugar transporter subunit IIB [Enterococcus sp.]|uniref:PTS sugar transporter subunit IIB n=1 Tax=Enterococcus sp. TaxID=35783 RepID=UPI0028A04C3E|nr:PTS sugar transporter subunit IIB [Enterococcus sp.]